MKHLFYRTSRTLWGIGLVFLFLSPLAWAQKGFEEMDLPALSAEAAQLQKQLDRNPADYGVLQELGIVYHYLAVKDSKAYAKKAVQVLEKANKRKSEDYTVLACLGSAYTLMAKDASSPKDKSDYFNKGVEYMDKAVRKDPDNVMVRMIRGNNSKGLPRFLNRRSVAYEDFEFLAGLFEKGQKFPTRLKALVYRHLTALYKEDGDPAKAKMFQARAQALDQEK